MIKIQPYDLTVHYLPGSNIPVPDVLSQLHLPNTDRMMHANIKVFVHTIANHMPLSHAILQETKDKTKLGLQLKQLETTIQEGWPSLQNQCRPNIRSCWNIQHELSAFDGMLFKCPQIIIPACLLDNTLEQLHSVHLGIEKTKQRACMLVDVKADINKFIKKYGTCAKQTQKNCW